jgi:hypothetical protein
LKLASTRTVDLCQRQTPSAQAAFTNPAIHRDRKDLFMKQALTAFWILLFCLGLAFSSDPSRAQHPGAQPMPSHGGTTAPPSGPANAAVEFENDSIVVVRIRMAPHEQTPMHEIASARLVVWLTEAHLRDTHPDGSADEIRRRPGDIEWVGVQRHAGENLSHEPLEFLAIVPKTGGATSAK